MTAKRPTQDGWQAPDEDRPRKLALFLRQEREEILREWEELVRDSLARAALLDREHLRDHIPGLIDQIAAMVERPSGGEHHVDARDARSREHARHRFDLGFSLEEVAREYKLLRMVILGRLGPYLGELPIAELALLDEVLDQAVNEAVVEYSEQAQKSLRASEERLRLVIDALPRLVSFVDQEQRHQLCNRTYERWFGVPVEQVTGRTVRDVMGEDNYRHVQPYVERALRGEDVTYEVPFVFGDGRRGTIEGICIPQRADGDSVPGYVSLVADITERKRAAHAARLNIDATEVLASSLDCETIVRELARVLVPGLADWCVIDVVTDQGTLMQAAAAHVDPRLARLAAELEPRLPADMELAHGVAGVLRTGSAELYPDIGAAHRLASVLGRGDPERLRELGAGACMCVPLAARGRVIGVLSFVRAAPGSYDRADLDLAEEIARRAGLSVDNARLIQAARRAVRLETLLSVHSDLFSLFDRDHRFTYASRSLLALLQKELDDVVGRGFDELPYPPELVALYWHLLDQAFSGRTVRSEAPYTSPAGEIRFYESIFVPVRDSDGAVEAVACVTRDTTERKRTEEVQRFLSDASAVLAEPLERDELLRRIARLAVPGFADWCVMDLVEPDGTLASICVEHADPERADWAQQLRRRYPPRPDELPWRVIRARQPELVHDHPGELLARHAQDAEHQSAIQSLGLRSLLIAPIIAGDDVIGVITFASAESRRLYREVELHAAQELARRAGMAIENARLYAAARDATRLREEVLAVVSHDLRNPLGVISMSATLLTKRLLETGGDEHIRKPIEVIQRSARRMEHLIGDLLDLAVIQAGHLSIEARPQEISAILIEAFEIHAPMARERGVALTRALPEGSFQVKCDRNRMLQALGNILGNAIDFCRAGQSITLSLQPRAREVVISVADTGPGIPITALPHVFEPYWTARPQTQKGTGLGLYITRAIIEAHGGRIWVESTVGEGTTFSFTLPRA